MKSFKSFINEALKINSKSKINKHLERQLLDDWTIDKAEDGDIVHNIGSELYFIYKCLNTDHKYKKDLSENTIIYHVAYDFKRDDLSIGPDCGIGGIEYRKYFELATIDKCEELFKALKNHLYKWDEINKKLVYEKH